MPNLRQNARFLSLVEDVIETNLSSKIELGIWWMTEQQQDRSRRKMITVGTARDVVNVRIGAATRSTRKSLTDQQKK